MGTAEERPCGAERRDVKGRKNDARWAGGGRVGTRKTRLLVLDLPASHMGTCCSTTAKSSVSDQSLLENVRTGGAYRSACSKRYIPFLSKYRLCGLCAL
ncbi:unnamed protein product [Toxocara canis]|uniref:Uncharacterized protein n=1 Tax=Toxocara canis TaxID=6265 RepID=A0A183UP71_TOXCA|nr:unnamed protein product [Toxocara canis]